MTKKQVRVGATYAAKVSGNIVPVTITREVTREAYSRGGWRNTTQWLARNERTGREVTIKSAARLRFEVEPYINSTGTRRWRRKEI